MAALGARLKGSLAILVPWPTHKCILCLSETQPTEEHIIPTSIGGRLSARFLCKPCNDRMGHDVDSLAKKDPSIALAIHQFSSKYPDWERKLNEGLQYKVRSSDGISTALFKKGKLQLRSEKLNDDSLIQPTRLARRSVANMLHRSGYEGAHLDSALENFDDTPDDERTEIVPGLEIVKSTITAIQPDLSKSVVSPIIAIKIAYEFLACHVENAIYSAGRELEAIRSTLINYKVDEDDILVQYMQAKRENPIHGIVIEKSRPYIRVQIRLFGTIVYRVHFRRLSFLGPRFVYTHEILTSKEGIREVPTKREDSGERSA